jgi:hypothetical protein
MNNETGKIVLWQSADHEVPQHFDYDSGRNLLSQKQLPLQLDPTLEIRLMLSFHPDPLSNLFRQGYPTKLLYAFHVCLLLDPVEPEIYILTNISAAALRLLYFHQIM